MGHPSPLQALQALQVSRSPGLFSLDFFYSLCLELGCASKLNPLSNPDLFWRNRRRWSWPGLIMKTCLRSSTLVSFLIVAVSAQAKIITVNTEDNKNFHAGITNLVTAINLLADGDTIAFNIPNTRSEERRVGKECRSRWSQ